MSKLSLKELRKQYMNRDKPHSLLQNDSSILSGDESVLVKLNNLYSTRSRGKFPVLAMPSLPESSKRKIALCFIVVDKFPHAKIWKRFLSSSSRFQADIFVHAKYPRKLWEEEEWLRDSILPLSFEPEWNCAQVIRAMLSTLKAAYSCFSSKQDVYYEHFMLLTESCLPLYSLDRLGEELFSSDFSRLQIRHTPESKWEEEHCFRPVRDDIIPQMAVSKGLPGWISLTRKHVGEIIFLLNFFGGWGEKVNVSETEQTGFNFLNLKISNLRDCDDLVCAFGSGHQWREGSGDVFAPEEMFFATLLTLLGYARRENGPSEVLSVAPVYASWKKRGDANPITYTSLSSSLLKTMRDSGALFGRKFSADVNLSIWEELVLEKGENQNFSDNYKSLDIERSRSRNRERKSSKNRNEERKLSRSRSRDSTKK